MVAAIDGVARKSATDADELVQVEPRKSFFACFMRELRLRQAHREIEKHAHLLAPDQFRIQGGPLMSLRILGSVICVGLFALATVIHAQDAPQTTSNSNIKVAQGTTQQGPADAPAKTSKSKVKKAKGGKGTGNGGAESRPVAPAGGSGPPDPGKY